MLDHKTPRGPECYSHRNKEASPGVIPDEMRQINNSYKKALLVAIPTLGLALGTAMGFALKSTARQVVGRMPEIVCIADRSFYVVDEIVVHATRPLSAVARLSEITK